MMRKIIIFFPCLYTFFVCIAQTPNVDANWSPIFEDSFDSFDNTLWVKAHNHVHGKDSSEEPQIYHSDRVAIITDPSSGDGRLRLRASYPVSPIPHPNNGQTCYYGGVHIYKSGQINSLSQYQYGYFEIYAKMPVGVRFWPAFWLFGCSNNPIGYYNEIDIMEIVKGWGDTTSSNVHYGINCDTAINHNYMQHTIANNHSFHWYGLEWTRTRLIWFLDNQIVRVDSNNYAGVGILHPMEIILNLAISPYISGDSFFDYPGDYIISQANVYELQLDTNTNVTIIPDFSTFNFSQKKTISLSSTTTIPNNAKLSLRAKDYIELKDGFEIPMGAEVYFEAGRYK